MKKLGTVILPDGNTCSGKSTYSRRLAKERGAVLFVEDEALIRLGATTMEQMMQVSTFVKDIVVQIAEAGTDVILESGYFEKADRDRMKAFFTERRIPYEWHFLDVSPETWRKNIAKRNAEHDAGNTLVYRIDDGLIAMFEEKFTPPSRDEVDVWVDNNY